MMLSLLIPMLHFLPLPHRSLKVKYLEGIFNIILFLIMFFVYDHSFDIYISYFTLGNEILTTKNATERFHSFWGETVCVGF